MIGRKGTLPCLTVEEGRFILKLLKKLTVKIK